MKSTKLKLYVWENVLHDYTPGIMFALAPDVETARRLLRERCTYLPQEDIDREPAVCETPVAYFLYGAG